MPPISTKEKLERLLKNRRQMGDLRAPLRAMQRPGVGLDTADQLRQRPHFIEANDEGKAHYFTEWLRDLQAANRARFGEADPALYAEIAKGIPELQPKRPGALTVAKETAKAAPGAIARGAFDLLAPPGSREWIEGKAEAQAKENVERRRAERLSDPRHRERIEAMLSEGVDPKSIRAYEDIVNPRFHADSTFANIDKSINRNVWAPLHSLASWTMHLAGFPKVSELFAGNEEYLQEINAIAPRFEETLKTFEFSDLMPGKGFWSNEVAGVVAALSLIHI